MRRAIVGSIVAAALMSPIAAPAGAAQRFEGEACEAVNPGQPKCTVTITSASTSGQVTGAVGAGEWSVVVKRGKKKIKFGPSGTEPEPVSFTYQIGDKVTATVTSAGGWVVAGHD